MLNLIPGSQRKKNIMTNPIIPTTDELFDAWLENLSMKFGPYAVSLGFTTEQAEAVTADHLWFHWALMAQQLFETEASERVALKQLLRDGPVDSPTPVVPSVPNPGVPEGDMPPPGIRPRMRKLVQAIKNHPNYTDAMGADMGLIASTPSESGTPKPDASGKAKMNSQVELRFKKGGHDAVIIESQRGSETGWTLLDKVLRSPWTDDRAPLVANQPEVRKYRLCYCDSDEAVGDFSDVITVVTVP